MQKSDSFYTPPTRKRHILFALATLFIAFVVTEPLTLTQTTPFCRAPSSIISNNGPWKIKLWTLTPTRSSSRRNTMKMHMHHSHSHHTHEHGVGHSPKLQVLKLDRARLSRLLFAAIATLVAPALIRRRFSTTKVDVLAFLITSTMLAVSGRLRLASRRLINGILEFRQGLLRHAQVQPGDVMTLGADGVTDALTHEAHALSAQEAKLADRVTFLGVIVNLLLSGGKLVGGYLFHSAALIADAGHSLSDLMSDFVTLWAVRIGRLPPDEDHPYGHGKFEAVGSLSVSVLLLFAGAGIGAGSYSRLIQIISGKAKSTPIPTAPALIVAAISVVSKEWLYRITHKVGEQIRSPVVMANAWHHRSDAYSSILALGSIAVAMTVPGMLAVDSAAGLLVAGMICTTGMEIFVDAMKQLTDTANGELVEKINKLLHREISQLEHALDIGRVRARQVGSSSLVDVTLTVSDGLSASATRAIEDRIRLKIMKETPGVLDADVQGRPELPASGMPAMVAEPILVVETLRPAELHASTVIDIPFTDIVQRTSSALERDIRATISRNALVKEISEVSLSVHNTRPMFDVTVTIRPKNMGNMTIAEATEFINELRYELEKESRIMSARINLDLNTKAQSAVDQELAEEESAWM